MKLVEFLLPLVLPLPLAAVAPLLPHECSPEREACSGNCPIFVDPNAVRNGSGRNWENATNDLQAALERQSKRGGGEVWVLAGEFPSLVGSGNPLVSMPSNVTLRGGFSGSETAPEQRTNSAAATVLRGPSDLPSSAPLLRIVEQKHVLVDRVRLIGGTPALLIENSHDVRLQDVSGEQPSGLAPAFRNSDVRLERVNFKLPFAYPSLEFNRSDVAIVGGILDGANRPFQLTSSRVLFEGIASNTPLVIDAASNALLVNSSFSGSADRSSVLRIEGRVALVGSQILRGGAASSINGAFLISFNSTFVGAHSQPQGGSYPQAAAIDVVDADVSATTFYDYWCQAPQACDRALSRGNVNNSLFVHAEPAWSEGQPHYPADQFVLGTSSAPPSNCATYALDLFRVTDGGQVLASAPPCPDAGDAALLEQSRARLLEFAAPFRAAPFQVDLSRYETPTWWQTETVRTDGALDSEKPDPGSHSQLARLN